MPKLVPRRLKVQHRRFESQIVDACLVDGRWVGGHWQERHAIYIDDGRSDVEYDLTVTIYDEGVAVRAQRQLIVYYSRRANDPKKDRSLRDVDYEELLPAWRQAMLSADRRRRAQSLFWSLFVVTSTAVSAIVGAVLAKGGVWSDLLIWQEPNLALVASPCLMVALLIYGFRPGSVMIPGSAYQVQPMRLKPDIPTGQTATTPAE